MDWERTTAECVERTRRLIRIPSMSGDEAALAAIVADDMRDLGFDEVWLDDVGNVSGRVQGREAGLGALVLNTHLDHVDPGDPALWHASPFAGEVVDGRIVGRGAADIKGPMAVQLGAVGALIAAGERPRRDVVVCSVVDEEVGGGGAVHWADSVDYPIDLILLGEPSSNDVALGHRGIAQIWLTFLGSSVHASAPERGENPNFALGRFLAALPDAARELGEHPVLGRTTVSPTVIEVDTTSPNVTPAWTRVLLDVRTACESYRSLAAFVDRLAGEWPHTLTDAWAEPGVGLPDSGETITGFYTPPESEAVSRVRGALTEGMGRRPALIRYQFATDGRHFCDLGATIMGYSPADEDQAHVANESIAIDRMAESLRGHVALLRSY